LVVRRSGIPAFVNDRTPEDGNERAALANVTEPTTDVTGDSRVGESLGIVVIGASRSGLDAISTIACALSPEVPVAIAVVLHTSPQSPRFLDLIIGSRAAIPVLYAAQGTAIRPGHLYFAPPDRHLIVATRGTFALQAGPKVRYSRPAVDRLFESAAAVFKGRVIGVVLTGGDGDGTNGLRGIHAAGGVGVVQEPADAFDPAMPTSALQTGSPDYRARIEDMGALLNTLIQRLSAKAGLESSDALP
jgi:two-component system chemotaxis response regulator CheB